MTPAHLAGVLGQALAGPRSCFMGAGGVPGAHRRNHPEAALERTRGPLSAAMDHLSSMVARLTPLIRVRFNSFDRWRAAPFDVVGYVRERRDRIRNPYRTGRKAVQMCWRSRSSSQRSA